MDAKGVFSVKSTYLVDQEGRWGSGGVNLRNPI